MLYASNVLEEDIKLSEEKKPSPTSLRDWTIRPFTINGISMVLAVNHETLMPAIIPGVEYLRVGVEFVLAQVVKQICSRLAINPDKATRYTDQILNGGVAYRNTSNDFLLERAFRYYVDAFSKITPEELESYEENDLLMGLAMESVTRGPGTVWPPGNADDQLYRSNRQPGPDPDDHEQGELLCTALGGLKQLPNLLS